MGQHKTREEDPIFGRIQFWKHKFYRSRGDNMLGLDNMSKIFHSLHVLNERGSASVPWHVFTIGNYYFCQICHDTFCE